MQRVVCPGSFDPVTNGHLDIIGRAAGLYDEVVVAVLINMTKKSLFTVDERVEMLGEVTSAYGNVRIDRFHGLLVDFCATNGINAVIKGLRAVSDFEYEMQMAQMNYRLAKVETLFMTTNPQYSFLQLEPDQGDRQVRRRRQRAGPRAGPLPAASAAWPRSNRAVTPTPSTCEAAEYRRRAVKLGLPRARR